MHFAENNEILKWPETRFQLWSMCIPGVPSFKKIKLIKISCILILVVYIFFSNFKKMT
jgi:hypothetical protein